MNYVSNPATWIVVLATIVAVVVCIAIHFEVLSHGSHWLPKISQRRRRRVIFLISVILLTHVVEIWIFGLAYYTLIDTHGIGSLASMSSSSLPDYVYFSAMVYTTVGFGDIVPVGPIRFMAGVEALTGLVMITWSASFTFLEMQRDWPRPKL